MSHRYPYRGMTLAFAMVLGLPGLRAQVDEPTQNTAQKTSYRNAADYLGATIGTRDGDTIGIVQGLVVDLGDFSVRFVVVDSTQFVGAESPRSTAIPFSLVTIRSDGEQSIAVADILRRQVETAPLCNPYNPDRHAQDLEWFVKMKEAFGKVPELEKAPTPMRVQSDETNASAKNSMAAPPRWVNAADLQLRTLVHAPDDTAQPEDVIDPPRQALHPPVIRHLVIALPSRRFVAVECEPDENQKRLIVPAQALKPTASNATWGLPFTSRQMLLAPRFEDAAVRVLKDPAARAQLDDFYDSGLAK